MDSEKSHAYFHYHPAKDGEWRGFYITSGLELRPYPNPFTYGGYWCSGSARDEAELKKHLDDFRKEVERWKKHGLVKVEIKQLDEIDLATRRLHAQAQLAKLDPKRYREDFQPRLW